MAQLSSETHRDDSDTAKEVALPAEGRARDRHAQPNRGQDLEVCPSELLPTPPAHAKPEETDAPEVAVTTATHLHCTAPEVVVSTAPEVSTSELPTSDKEALRPSHGLGTPSPASSSLSPPAVEKGIDDTASGSPPIHQEIPPDVSWFRRHRRLLILIICLFMTLIIVAGATVGGIFATRPSSSPTASEPAANGTFNALPISKPSYSEIALQKSYKATFTYYGSGDYGGSPNCNTSRNACARPPDGRYTAAVSEALFGAAPGEGAGMACGTCWRLDTADCSVPSSSASSSAAARGSKVVNKGLGLKSITVVVNNLCPAAGNPLCGQRDLKHTNQYGAEVNFNLCIDSGAASALFAKSGLGLTTGTATSVDCDSDAAYPECPSLPSH